MNTKRRLPLDSPIDSLRLSGYLRNALKRMGYRSLRDVLEKTFAEVLDVGYRGLKIQLIAELLEHGYTVKDGLLLDQNGFGRAISNGRMYRTILKMNDRGLISKKFKLWCNVAIRKIANEHKNQKNRKHKIVPFKVD